MENPDRILVGCQDTDSGKQAAKKLIELYQYWVPQEKIITTRLYSAELSKLASNALLAQRISSINSLSIICEQIGADIEEVSQVVGSDNRIGKQYLNASVGFGGSCLKKDLLGLIYLCESLKLNEVADYWRSVVTMNEYQKQRFSQKIVQSMFDNVKGKNIAILGNYIGCYS